LVNLEADVVVTKQDINMPEMDGISLTEILKKLHPHIKVIALTMHKEGQLINDLISKGVDGYLLKDSSEDELVYAIQSVYTTNDKYFSRGVTTSLIESLGAGDEKSNPIPDLSEREIEILKLIAKDLTQKEIAERLFISPHTVVFHKRKLITKLDVKGIAGLVKKAIEMGIVE